MAAGFHDVGRLVATLGLNTTPFMAGMNAAQSKMAQFNMAAMMIGRTMTRFVTLPMAIAGGAAVGMHKKFEASMTKIIGLVGVARDQVEKWNKEVLKMARITGRGPEELADALFFVTSAGIRGAEAMEVLEMSAKAAASGLGETKVIADLVTSAMNAYGRENLSAAQATDILVAAVREGKAEADELAGAMGMVLPIASEFGVTFDQVGAAFAAMTRTGTNARVAATQLKAIMSAMASPSMQAADAMAKYGTNAETFRKTVREKGLITALLDLKDVTEGNEEAMAGIFPNIRALMGTLDLLGANMNYNVRIFEALKNAGGSLEKAFEEVGGTVQQKLNVALATFKTTLVELGEVLKPFVVKQLASLSDMLKKVSANFQTMTVAQKKTKTNMLLLTAAAGPLLIIVSKLSQIIKTIIPLLGTAGGPIFAIAAAMGAVVLVSAKLFTSMETANKVRRRTQKEQEKIAQNLTGESVKVEILFDKLKKAKKGTEEWGKARDAINRNYSEYLDNLITEKTTLAEIEAAQKKVTEARYLDIASKSYSKESDRIMEEYVASYGKKMKKWNTVVSEGWEELWDMSKETPAGFAKAMHEGLAKSVDLNVAKDISKISGEIFDTFIKGLSNAPKVKTARNDFIGNFFSTLYLKKAADEQVQVITDMVKGMTDALGSGDTKSIAEQIINLDKQIKNTEKLRDVEGERSTLLTLISLQTQKGKLLTGEAKALNMEIVADLQKQLRAHERVLASLSEEARLEAKIKSLEDARKKIKTSELEANSKSIAQAKLELKTLQLENSGLSEIEKKRGRIELMREKGLYLTGLEEDKNKEAVAQAVLTLRLIELEASGLSDIEKARGRIVLMQEAGRRLNGEAEKQNLVAIRNAQQLLRMEELKAQGASKLLLLQEELSTLEENMAFLDDDKARRQSVLIENKERQIELQKEELEGLNEIGRQTNALARLEKESSRYEGDQLAFHKQLILAKQLQIIEIKKEKGALSALEVLELELLRIELLRASVTTPDRAAALKAEGDEIERQIALLKGEVSALFLIKNAFMENAQAANLMAKAFTDIGTALGNVIAGTEGSFKAMVTSVLDGISQIITALLAKAIALYMTSKVAIPGGLFWAAGGAAVITALWKSAIPDFASGGIAYGETLARVGEYPGAKSNPEVIAPLSDLKKFFGGKKGGLPQVIILRAEGRDLVATIDQELLNQNIY